MALSVSLLATPPARAEEPADALPGSPKPSGLGLSPDAPPKPAAPGGRAPSYGAPAEDQGDWSFRFGGKFEFATSVGIFERDDPRPGQSDLVLRTPAVTQGYQPFQRGARAGLFLVYGNALVSGTVSFGVGATGREHEGYYSPQQAPNVEQAYLTITPQPLGRLRLHAKVGAFTEAYGSPGQWGWGLFGPLIATRGYGEVINAEYEASSELRFTLAHGVLSVPGVPENYVRGTFTGWNETGVSTFGHHGHVGFNLQNKYVFKLHYAHMEGTDERRLLQIPHDGTLDVYVAEAHYYPGHFGQIGVSGAYWDLDHANAVHDGIWWALDWTQGGKDMATQFLGPGSMGSGKIAAVSAQYELSLARILWHPLPFDGRSPDLGIIIAGVRHWTIESGNDDFSGTSGYMIGTELDYRMLPWFSGLLRGYGRRRHSALGSWEAFSISPGVSFRADWQSAFRIELFYTRHFYSDAVDNNSEDPLDRNVVSLGGQVEF